MPAFAQETLSLRGLIEEARNNNPELEALRRNIKAKEAKARAEGVLDDPSFRIEMMDLSKENPFPTPGNAMQTKYGISQMFPYPGKRALQKDMALKEVLMAGVEVKVRELEIVTMVKEAYYDYLLMSESIKIVKEIKGLLSSMTEIAKIKYATGQASQQDVIKAQVELTMLINEITELEAEREVVQVGLKALLNRPQEAPLPDPPAIPKKKADIKVEELTEKALEINPALQKMRYEIEANQIGVELARKNYYPDFMVDLAPIQRDGRFDAWDAMFQINIPIWQSKYDSQVTEAQSSVEAGQYQLKAEENIRSAEVKEGVVKVESADRIRTLYETSLLPQVDLSFDSALKNYQTGKIDFLTLLDTERVLRKTRIDYIGSLVTYYKRIASLEGVVGEEILEE
ncbi:MAG TPA: TolC family protein [Thermodesulfobacteriota bacterium]|nr:TolC family protein [Thermodesulfobacteriota bacterium]